MKEVVVLSGKGGTGKTSLVASLAVLAWNKIMVDCDVDAANLHLLMDINVCQEEPFYGLEKAYIDTECCTKCGICQDMCAFNAIKDFTVDSFACEGCRICSITCPSGAIQFKEHLSGHIKIAHTKQGELVYGDLLAGEENSGKLVARVKKIAREKAIENGYDLILIDGPPGIGCPVISCLPGVDLALVVAEPTLAGMHDLERLLQLANHFNVRVMVCINKWDISKDNTSAIEELCRRRKIEVIGRIPYDSSVFCSLREGRPYIMRAQSPATGATLILWERLSREIYS